MSDVPPPPPPPATEFRGVGKLLRRMTPVLYTLSSIMEFTNIEMIGKGHYATVFRARHPRFADSGVVAVRCETWVSTDRRRRERHERMIQAYLRLDGCQFLAPMLGHALLENIAFDEDHRRFVSSTMNTTGVIVQPLYDATVDRWIVQHSNAMTIAPSIGQEPETVAAVNTKKKYFEDAMVVVACVADALRAMHEARIVYRDLKPDNVVLLLDSSDRARIKSAVVSDLGFSFTEGEYSVQELNITLVPLEVICRNPFTTASDVYQFGVFFACVFLLKRLLGDDPSQCLTTKSTPISLDKNLIDSIVFNYRSAFPQYERLAELLHDSLSNNVGQRPTMKMWVDEIVATASINLQDYAPRNHWNVHDADFVLRAVESDPEMDDESSEPVPSSESSLSVLDSDSKAPMKSEKEERELCPQLWKSQFRLKLRLREAETELIKTKGQLDSVEKTNREMTAEHQSLREEFEKVLNRNEELEKQVKSLERIVHSSIPNNSTIATLSFSR